MSDLWVPGQELPRMTRTMTAERMRWYCDALDTVLVDEGRVVLAGTTIHTDDAFARASGLPGRVADGMISTNWLSGMLTAAFGDAYLRAGSLRTRYVRPVFEDDRLEAVVRFTAAEPQPDGGTLVRADVWCENERGETCTVGDASVVVPDA